MASWRKGKSWKARGWERDFGNPSKGWRTGPSAMALRNDGQPNNALMAAIVSKATGRPYFAPNAAMVAWRKARGL